MNVIHIYRVVNVENDVWIGPGMRILGEVDAESNSINGANAVITRDVVDGGLRNE